jgi:hypothetical protein
LQDPHVEVPKAAQKAADCKVEVCEEAKVEVCEEEKPQVPIDNDGDDPNVEEVYLVWTWKKSKELGG